MRSHTSRLKSTLRAHQTFLLIVVGFLTFRLLLPFVFRNGSYFVEQAPDISDYLRWGMLADSRLYPFVDYWSEYPPLFAWSIIGLYRLSILLPAWLDQRLWFSISMQLAMTLFDLGSVLLVYKIAQRFSTRLRATRAAALFAASFILAYGASGWYEPVPLFFLLLTLYLTLRERYAWSAVTAAVGLMTKLVPIVIVPIALQRLTSWRRRAGYLGMVAACSIGLVLPFVIVGQDYVIAFVRATLNRPSWLSIWALFDGNTTFGASVPIIERFSPQNVGVAPASVIPVPLVTLAFAILFVFLYTRRVDWRDARQATAFAGITVILFLLWSKGFSGQFTVYVLPFVALLLPNLRGALYLALLSVLWVAEWPLAFQMMDGQTWFLTWLIIVRTITLIVLVIEFMVVLFPAITRYSLLVTRYALLLCWLTIPVVGLAAVNRYAQARLATDPAAPAIDLVQTHNTQAPLVFAETKLYRRLYPAAQSLGEVLLLPGAKHVPEEVRTQWLDDLAARGSFWLIADEGDPESVAENHNALEFVSKQVCKVDTQWGGSALVSRFVGRNGMPRPVITSAIFGDQIELTGANLYPETLRPGGTLCVELNWRALIQPAGDYTVFVHLVDPNGQVVAQTDMQPQGSFAPTHQWAAGTPQIDRHGLILPDKLPAGKYTLRLGLYRSEDQSPLRVTRGESLMPDAIGINLSEVDIAP